MDSGKLPGKRYYTPSGYAFRAMCQGQPATRYSVPKYGPRTRENLERAFRQTAKETRHDDLGPHAAEAIPWYTLGKGYHAHSGHAWPEARVVVSPPRVAMAEEVQ